MTSRLPVESDRLLQLQAGLITRAQALSAGMSRHALQAKLGSGRWRRMHNGVYAAFSGPPGRDSVLWAAVLGAGPRAVLSHETAAELHGLLSAGARPGRTVHVTVPRGRQAAAMRHVRLHYSGRLDESRHPVLLPPATRFEDTILDLAVTAATVTDGISWVLRACGTRRTTPGRLRQAMAARRRHQLIVELDGRAAHPGQERWRDIHRDNASAAGGCVTLRYSWSDVTLRTCEVAAEVGRVLRSRGWTGQLRRCGPDCAARDQPGRLDAEG